MFVKILLTVLTFLTVLAMLGFCVYGFFFIHQAMLGVVCLALAAGFGYFSFNDFKYWKNYFSQKK